MPPSVPHPLPLPPRRADDRAAAIPALKSHTSMYTINLDNLVGILFLLWIIRVVRRVLIRARLLKYYDDLRRRH